ncbi:MAG: D-alanyl-D-alanine carboxypeptidase family protein, partial [Oscillospiraceae bacterium]
TTTVYASDSEAQETLLPADFAIAAKAGVLIDQINGTVLYEKNPHEKMPPASITKIMTMLLVMEAIDGGKVKMEDMVTASAHASSMGGTQIWLKENEQMTVHDLMKACAVASANDAAMALAEHIGGSEEGFVAMMNNKAIELKMADTTFINPTGLDAKGHLSSAYDIALMSKSLLAHKEITAFTSIYMDSLRGGKTELVNTNKLVRFYKGCTGLKTGTTDGAGSCVSVSATKENMGLISVVMGATTSKDRFNSAKQLLDYGFSNFAVYNTAISNDTLKPVKVIGGVSATVDVESDKGSSIIIKKGKSKDIVENVTIVQDVEAPVLKGQKLGEIKLSIDGEEIANFSVNAKTEVVQITMFNAFTRLFSRLAKM